MPFPAFYTFATAHSLHVPLLLPRLFPFLLGAIPPCLGKKNVSNKLSPRYFLSSFIMLRLHKKSLNTGISNFILFFQLYVLLGGGDFAEPFLYEDGQDFRTWCQASKKF
jgi:hypothetical protein